MDDKQLEAILSKLDEIEKRLKHLESSAPATPVTPPVITPPPFNQQYPAQPHRRAEEIRASLLDPPKPTTSTLKPATPRHDVKPIPPDSAPVAKSEPGGMEYSVGAKFLPLAGAGLTILAIIYFTTEAFKNGWITSQMIFGATVILCLAFIGVGQFLRDEKEQFGQILTGVGSCGLYITFAAGHFAQNLYPASTMLGLFMVLSLINLGYGFWKGSTAFLRIGVSGGFTASFLPLVQATPQIETHLLLHALIVVPAALIIARHKWQNDAMLFLPSAVLVTVPALWMPGSEWHKIAELSLIALLAAYAYARSFKATGFDPTAIFLPMSLAGIAWINFEIRDSYLGSVHIIAFGLAIYALSKFKFDSIVVRQLQFAALTIPLILAPWGATKVESAFILSALAIGLAWLGNRQKSRLLQGLAGLEAGLAVTAYIVAIIQNKIPSWQLESAILVALIVAGTYALTTVYKAFESKEQNLAVGGSILGLLSLRLLTLSLTQSPAELSPAAAFLISFVVLATLFHTLGNLFKSASLQVIGTTSSFSSLIVFSFFAMDVRSPQFGENAILTLVLLASAFYLFRLYWVDSNHAKKSAAVAILVPAAGLLAHLVYICLTHPIIHAVPETAIVWGLLTATIALRFFAQKLEINDLRSIAISGLCVTYASYVLTRSVDPTHFLWAESTLLLALGALVIYFARLEWNDEPNTQHYIAGAASVPLAAILFWLLQIIQVQGLERDAIQAQTLSGVLVTCVICAVLSRKSWTAILIPAWICWLIAAAPAQILNEFTPGTFALLLIAQLALAFAPEKHNPQPGAHRYLHLTLTTVLISRIGSELLPISIANPTATPSLTATWTALSIVFLILGFAIRITEIRHAGLALLFLASAKLIILDLSETAEFIRVAVTLGLGLAMIGGGYLYIKLQNRLTPHPTETVPIQPGQPSQEPGN